MKNTKERRPSLKALLAKAAAESERALAAARELKTKLDASERQRHDLIIHIVKLDKKLGVALWALELAHKENCELQRRLDFLSTPEEMAKRDNLANAS